MRLVWRLNILELKIFKNIFYLWITNKAAESLVARTHRRCNYDFPFLALKLFCCTNCYTWKTVPFTRQSYEFAL